MTIELLAERDALKRRSEDYESALRKIIRLFGTTPWVDQEDRDAIEAARNVIHKHTGERPL